MLLYLDYLVFLHNRWRVSTWRWQYCQPYAPAAFTPPGNIPGNSVIMSRKNSNDTSSVVPHPTALPRPPPPPEFYRSFGISWMTPPHPPENLTECLDQTWNTLREFSCRYSLHNYHPAYFDHFCCKTLPINREIKSHVFRTLVLSLTPVLSLSMT
jgi:hypothetical protein